MNVILVVRKKDISSVGSHSIWKTTKSFILEEDVKTTNLEQKWIFRYYKEQKHKKVTMAIV